MALAAWHLKVGLKWHRIISSLSWFIIFSPMCPLCNWARRGKSKTGIDEWAHFFLRIVYGWIYCMFGKMLMSCFKNSNMPGFWSEDLVCYHSISVFLCSCSKDKSNPKNYHLYQSDFQYRSLKRSSEKVYELTICIPVHWIQWANKNNNKPRD